MKISKQGPHDKTPHNPLVALRFLRDNRVLPISSLCIVGKKGVLLCTRDKKSRHLLIFP